MSRPKHIHIVLLGKQIDHALTGVRELDGDVVHFITSEELLCEGMYEQLEQDLENEIKFDFGGFHSIPNERLFSPFIVGDMLEIVTDIVAHESNEDYHLPALDLLENSKTPEWEGDVGSWNNSYNNQTDCIFFVGFTGGTKLMSGSAIHCANMIGAVSYYVAEGSHSMEPEVICLGSLEAPAVLLSAPDECLDTIFEYPAAEYKWVPTTNLLIRELVHLNLANEKITESGTLGYELTKEGYAHVKIAAERKLRKKSMESMTPEEVEELKNKWSSSNNPDVELDWLQDRSTLIETFFEVGYSNTEEELLQVILEKHGITGRAELREIEKSHGIELYLEIIFEDREGNEVDIGGFRQQRYGTDRIPFIEDLLLNRRYRPIDPEATRIISGDNDAEFLHYIAIKHFEKLGFKVR